MGNSHHRDIHLQRIKNETMNAQDFVSALERSPFRTHRKVAIGLREQLGELSRKAIEELKKKGESDDFKKSLGL